MLNSAHEKKNGMNRSGEAAGGPVMGPLIEVILLLGGRAKVVHVNINGIEKGTDTKSRTAFPTSYTN